MPTTTRLQRRYDHRLRNLVQTTGDLELAIRHGVPRFTARGARAKITTEVVSLNVVELDTIRLQHEVIRLCHRIRTVETRSCTDGNHVLELVDRVLVASGQAPVVVLEHARYRSGSTPAHRVLRERIQRSDAAQRRIH